jgi:hypothetical protein
VALVAELFAVALELAVFFGFVSRAVGVDEPWAAVEAGIEGRLDARAEAR